MCAANPRITTEQPVHMWNKLEAPITHAQNKIQWLLFTALKEEEIVEMLMRAWRKQRA
jgi:hypothetical protein